MTALAYLELALSGVGALCLVCFVVFIALFCIESARRTAAAHERGVERLRADRDRQARLRLITSPEPERRGGVA